MRCPLVSRGRQVDNFTWRPCPRPILLRAGDALGAGVPDVGDPLDEVGGSEVARWIFTTNVTAD